MFYEHIFLNIAGLFFFPTDTFLGLASEVSSVLAPRFPWNKGKFCRFGASRVRAGYLLRLHWKCHTCTVPAVLETFHEWLFGVFEYRNYTDCLLHCIAITDAGTSWWACVARHCGTSSGDWKMRSAMFAAQSIRHVTCWCSAVCPTTQVAQAWRKDRLFEAARVGLLWRTTGMPSVSPCAPISIAECLTKHLCYVCIGWRSRWSLQSTWIKYMCVH